MTIRIPKRTLPQKHGATIGTDGDLEIQEITGRKEKCFYCGKAVPLGGFGTGICSHCKAKRIICCACGSFFWAQDDKTKCPICPKIAEAHMALIREKNRVNREKREKKRIKIRLGKNRSNGEKRKKLKIKVKLPTKQHR